MAQAKRGDKVQVHFTGRLDDGTIFDSSEGRGPLEFVIGEGMVIPGFSEAVEGMAPGDERTALIPADQAYGPRQEDLVIVMSRANMPEDIDLEVDDELQLRRRDGQIVNVTVIDITEESLTLDANHPLAGEDLEFEIQLVNIV